MGTIHRTFGSGEIRYDTTIVTDEYGNVIVDAEPQGDGLEVTYCPECVASEPTAHLGVAAGVSLSEAWPLARQIASAYSAMDEMCSLVRETYRLRASDPGGSGADRARAIVAAMHEHRDAASEDEVREAINEAIRSCYRSDERCLARRELDALYNRCIDDDGAALGELRETLSVAFGRASDFLVARATEGRLSATPCEEALDGVIEAVVMLSEKARQSGMRTRLATLDADEAAVSPLRERIGELVAEMFDEADGKADGRETAAKA